MNMYIVLIYMYKPLSLPWPEISLYICI